ncbi:hypothetical protein ACNKHT_26095 [Shigella flexneri]
MSPGESLLRRVARSSSSYLQEPALDVRDVCSSSPAKSTVSNAPGTGQTDAARHLYGS